MKESEIPKIFESLPLPQQSSASSCSFSAFSLMGDSSHKLAKDEGGCPCLLVATGMTVKAQTRIPLVLENLAVLFDLRCQISSPNASMQTGTFTVLKCVAADLVVRRYFLSLLPGISAAIGRTSDRAKVATVIEDLVELFRSLGALPKKEIQGVWGELLLIHEAKDPLALAEAWHAEPTDRYDFNKGTERIDVKTTSQAQRRHHFSLEQLCPPKGTELLIASIIVQRSGGGQSIFDLLEEIRLKIARKPQIHLRIMRQIHESLGNAWQSAYNIRFDYEAARQSIHFYNGSQIPKIPLPLPEGISDVSFLVNLAGIPILSEKPMTGRGSLFRSFFVGK